MKRAVRVATLKELSERYPRHEGVDGWRFRIEETSACVYVVEGRDRVGRMVSRHGEDVEALLEGCKSDARSIQRGLVTFVDVWEFYASIDVLCYDLELAGLGAVSMGIRDAMQVGATSGEVLGALRSELRGIVASAKAPPDFDRRLETLIGYVDRTLGRG